MRCRDIVRAEFERRRRINPRYSLRRFAQTLGVHHSILSRLLHGRRAPAPTTVRGLAAGLGLSPSATRQLVAEETADALIEAIRSPGFRPDTRQLAMRSGIAVDDVNIALHSLLRNGRLRMVSAEEWVITTGASS